MAKMHLFSGLFSHLTLFFRLIYKVGFILFIAFICSGCEQKVTPEPSDIPVKTSLSSNTVKEGFSHHNVQYWVNSQKKPCVGIAPMNCLQVQTGETIDEGGWELFYSPIEGFDYEEGYQYLILVEVRELSAKQTPADASSQQYQLLAIKAKTLQPSGKLSGKWTLVSINQKAVDVSAHHELPVIEISLNDMYVSGTDSCNQFNGQILTIENQSFKLGPVASTRKYCQDMKLADNFNNALFNAQSYRYDGETLVIADSHKNEVLRFKPAGKG